MRRRGLILVLTLTVTLPAASDARAQHALDRNLQQGSGGINAPAPLPYAIDGGNALITGNVTGTSNFRGQVDYVAPGQFQGTLGSDDLFRFRAQSWSPGSSPAALDGVSAAGGGIAPASPFTSSVVLPSSSAVSVGDVAGGGGMASGLPMGGLRLATPTATAITGINIQPQQGLGLLRQSDGTVLQIIASPLLGVRREILERETTGATPVVETASPANAPDNMPANAVNLPPPSLALGLQLQAMQEPAMLQPGWARGQAELVRELEQHLLTPRPTEPGAPTDGMADPYLSILAQVQARHRTGAPPPPEASAPAAESQAPAPSTPAAGGDLPRLEAPTPQQRAAAQAARERAMLAARGLSSPNPPADGATPNAQADPRLQQWIIALDYDLPALATLATTRQDRVNRLLRQAETALGDGRYFDAEGQYRQALVADPRHPLARVGLVHAQLGAGLIRSAALNLRTVLSEHPELIAARYEARLLPTPERLVWVRQQLEQMLRLSTRPEPALLLAYLGYQTRVDELTGYGLDLAAARYPHDPLTPLLRRLWLPDPGDAPHR